MPLSDTTAVAHIVAFPPQAPAVVLDASVPGWFDTCPAVSLQRALYHDLALAPGAPGPLSSSAWYLDDEEAAAVAGVAAAANLSRRRWDVRVGAVQSRRSSLGAAPKPLSDPANAVAAQASGTSAAQRLQRALHGALQRRTPLLFCYVSGRRYLPEDFDAALRRNKQNAAHDTSVPLPSLDDPPPRQSSVVNAAAFVDAVMLYNTKARTVYEARLGVLAATVQK